VDLELTITLASIPNVEKLWLVSFNNQEEMKAQ
jgi:hypothetical protein